MSGQFNQGNKRAAKLTGEEVVEMRRLYNLEGWTQSSLARHFDVSINTVGNIVREVTWRNIAGAGMPSMPRSLTQGRVPVTTKELTADELAASVARMLAYGERQEPTGEGMDKLLNEAASPEVDELLNTLETKHD